MRLHCIGLASEFIECSYLSVSVCKTLSRLWMKLLFSPLNMIYIANKLQLRQTKLCIAALCLDCEVLYSVVYLIQNYHCPYIVMHL